MYTYHGMEIPIEKPAGPFLEADLLTTHDPNAAPVAKIGKPWQM